VTRQQGAVESAEVRIVAHGDQGGHVEGATQVAVAGALMRERACTEVPDW
jgi:hypothetical protein